MAVEKKAQQIIDKYNTLKTQRVTWEEHWQEIADYFLPMWHDCRQFFSHLPNFQFHSLNHFLLG